MLDVSRSIHLTRKYRDTVPQPAGATRSMTQITNFGTIEVRITDIAQLFNSFDPSPFHERDLDRDAETHIVGWARELPASAPIRIVVDLPQAQIAKAVDHGLSDALAHYFAGRAQQTRRDMRELFRIGRRILAISVPFLILCLIASQTAPRLVANAAVAKVIEESFILVGWVANWRPIEIFLFEWLPLQRNRNLYERLAAAEVVTRAR